MSRKSYQSPKLQERESARGAEWFIRYSVAAIELVNGVPQKSIKGKHAALGLKRDMTKAQAGRARDEIMRAVNSQSYQMQSHVLFADFVAVFREQHYRGLKKTTQESYDGRLNKWILPALGEKKLYQISTLDVTRLLGAMETAGVAKKTRETAKNIISTIFTMGRKWGYLEKSAWNPAIDAEVGRTPGATREIWTPTMDEAQAILTHCAPPLDLMVELVIWTGMRVSEVFGLRCKNVNIETGVVLVKERKVRNVMDTPKSGAGNRALPLGDLVSRIAPLIGEPEEFLFRFAGVPYGDRQMEDALHAAMDAAGVGVKGNLWHSFRRLHGRMMSNHMNDFDLQKQMGHTDLQTTRLYVNDDLRLRREALQKAQAKVIPIRRTA